MAPRSPLLRLDPHNMPATREPEARQQEPTRRSISSGLRRTSTRRTCALTQLLRSRAHRCWRIRGETLLCSIRCATSRKFTRRHGQHRDRMLL